MCDEMRLVRGSEVQDFLRCRLRWRKRWVDQIRPIKQDGKLFFGNLFHKFAEEYYQGFDHPLAFAKMQDLFNQSVTSRMEQVEIDELWNLATEVTNNYVDMWAEKDKGMKVIATEFTFAIPMTDEIAYTGTIDLIWWQGGKLWFKDYKTTILIDKYAKKAKMDRQISRYFWALQQLSEGNGYMKKDGKWVHVDKFFSSRMPAPHGFLYDIVKRDVPKIPEPLKKGGLSKAKNQNTTCEVYLKALEDHGLMVVGEDGNLEPPAEYTEILEHLESQEDEHGNKFFKRVPVYRQPEELESAMQEFYATAMDMLQLRKAIESGEYENLPHDPIYRNITDECGWDCSYQGLCIALMEGSHTEGLMDMFYEKIPEDELDQQHLEVGEKIEKIG
jgi:hypothetical protein